MISCDSDPVLSSRNMLKKGYRSSACIDKKQEYTLEGLDYENHYKYVEMSVERCD